MKNKKSEVLFFAIITLLVIIFAIVTKEYKFFILLGVGVFFIFIALMIVFFVNLKNKTTKNQIVKRYNLINEKLYKTVFEQLYVLFFKNKIEQFLTQEIKKSKLEKISDFISHISNKETLILFYSYKHFRVFIQLQENKILYLKDSPMRYDGTKNNEQFEKMQSANFSPNDYNSFDEFITKLIDLIKNVNNEINIFSVNNVVDDLFNGRLFNKISCIKNYFKQGILLTIFSLIITVLLVFGFFVLIKDQLKQYLTSIFIICSVIIFIIIALFVFGFIYGIYLLIKYFNLKHDLKQKSFKTINEKPYKIKIYKERVSQYSDNFQLVYMALYYDGLKLYLPLQNMLLHNKKYIKKCCEKCLQIQCEIKYLTASKIVIDGEEKYLTFVKKYLTR